MAVLRMSAFWQHESPLSCPLGHGMIWLGSRYWICPSSGCNRIYVEMGSGDEHGDERA